MTPEEDKVQRFLDQFGSEDEFIAWCRGNGVRGCPVQAFECLMSEAIVHATGVETSISTDRIIGQHTFPGLGGWRLAGVYGSTRHPMPAPLEWTPKRFDHDVWPDLTRPCNGPRQPRG
jgi:hypothetical protein